MPHLDRSVSSPSRGSGLEGGGAEDDPPPLKKARSEPLEDYSKCGVTTKAPSSSAQKVCLPRLANGRHLVHDLKGGVSVW